MRAGSAPARVGSLLPRRSSRGWLRHLLLALSLVVVTLSVVGMHQLSVGHEVATGPTGAHPHTHSPTATHDAGAMPAGMANLAAGHAAGGDAGDQCPGCGDHEMAFGSCLLALVLLVLAWTLLPPRLRQLPPSLLPRAPQPAPRSLRGRLVPALSLPELSLRRT